MLAIRRHRLVTGMLLALCAAGLGCQSTPHKPEAAAAAPHAAKKQEATAEGPHPLDSMASWLGFRHAKATDKAPAKADPKLEKSEEVTTVGLLRPVAMRKAVPAPEAPMDGSWQPIHQASIEVDASNTPTPPRPATPHALPPLPQPRKDVAPVPVIKTGDTQEDASANSPAPTSQAPPAWKDGLPAASLPQPEARLSLNAQAAWAAR